MCGDLYDHGLDADIDEARVILPPEARDDEGVRIVPKTERAGKLIHEAFAKVRSEANG